MGSHLQTLVADCCRFWFPNHLIEDHRPPWLFGMELDIFIPSQRLAIEVQGKQHYLWNPALQATLQDHTSQRRRDSEKLRLCHKQGITLLKIGQEKTALWNLWLKIRRCRTAIKRPPMVFFQNWKRHCRTLSKLGARSPMIKVRKGRLEGCNRAGADYLKKIKRENFLSASKDDMAIAAPPVAHRPAGLPPVERVRLASAHPQPVGHRATGYTETSPSNGLCLSSESASTGPSEHPA